MRIKCVKLRYRKKFRVKCSIVKVCVVGKSNGVNCTKEKYNNFIVSIPIDKYGTLLITIQFLLFPVWKSCHWKQETDHQAWGGELQCHCWGQWIQISDGKEGRGNEGHQQKSSGDFSTNQTEWDSSDVKAGALKFFYKGSWVQQFFEMNPWQDLNYNAESSLR